MDERIAIHYTDAQLESLLTDLESDLTERKESLRGDAPTTIRQAICAFANDLPDHKQPGVILVGAKDSGDPSRLHITDDILLQLANMKTDGNIVPPPTLTVEKKTLSGVDMAVVTVMPCDSPPVRYKGRIWIRVGPRRDIASAQDERILNEKRRHRDRPYDVQPIEGASLADLDRTFFDDVYVPSAFASDVIERNDRTYEQRLAASKMIASADDVRVTLLGVLTLGNSPRDFLPGAYVQFLRVDGVTLGDPVIDEGLIDGKILDMMRRLDEKLIAHNRTNVEFADGLTERRHPLYPHSALQQLTRNAVLHRNYEGTNAPVRVTWYTDRIEIISPGGPYGMVNAGNFGDPGVTDYRNPNLAEVMRALGLVQRFGAGIPTARRDLQQNGNPPPEFKVDTNNILATIRPGA